MMPGGSRRHAAGEVFASIPFFDQKRVVALLDRLPEMDVGARTANGQVLMQLMSISVLHGKLGTV